MKDHERLHGSASDEGAVDRLIDETLRSLARPQAVDLRQRVLAQIEAEEAAGPSDGGARTAAHWAWPAFGLRPGLVGAGSLAIILAASIGLWPVLFDTDRGVPQTMVHTDSSAKPTPEAGRSNPAGEAANAEGRLTHAATDDRGLDTRRAAAGRTVTWPERPAPRGANPSGWQIEPVGLVAADTVGEDFEPYMPGAPAGNLGDPLKPMAALRPIAITPIETAPPISELARPVSDLTHGDPPAETATTGSSGGRK